MRSALSFAAALLLAAALCAVFLPGGLTSAARSTPGSLGGVVLDTKAQPLAGANVFWQASDGRSPHRLHADHAGRFYIARVRPGLYDLRAQAKGMWSEWQRNVLVRSGRLTEVTLRLLLPPPPPKPASPPVELTGQVREWAVPAADSLPHDPAVDPQGNVWLTLMRANQVARFNPANSEWKLFAAKTPDAGPHGLVADANGNIWFTENYVGKIARVDARTGEVTEYATPAKDPHTPVIGPDGAVWFTAQGANLIVRMDMETHAMREFHVPTFNSHPYGIAVGPDGALWFCEFGADKLGRLDPATGAITEFYTLRRDERPRRLVVAGDSIYYTDFHGGRLGRFNVSTKQFQVWPSPSGPDSEPYGIAADTTGKIWYCEVHANKLVRFDPQTQAFQSFPLPSERSVVRNMARDARGHIWMALSGANKVAVIE